MAFCSLQIFVEINSPNNYENAVTRCRYLKYVAKYTYMYNKGVAISFILPFVEYFAYYLMSLKSSIKACTRKKNHDNR